MSENVSADQQLQDKVHQELQDGLRDGNGFITTDEMLRLVRELTATPDLSFTEQQLYQFQTRDQLQKILGVTEKQFNACARSQGTSYGQHVPITTAIRRIVHDCKCCFR